MSSRLKTQTIKSRHVVWQRQRRSCVIKKQQPLNYKTIISNESISSSSSSSTTDCERKALAAGVMMSHKYKPRVFQDIVGHKTVIKTLSNAIQHKKIAPLYLFHGPNGTGKTSTATVFAMALNCQSTHHTKPCCTCKPCTSFKTTTTVCSAYKIAPAFHKIKTTSFLATTQILIIQECHLLTSEAWNELITLLDANLSLVFLLITTTHSISSSNIPNHISSRCHKFCFPKLKDEDITKKLSRILLHQGMGIQKQAMKLIVAKSQGSLRDAENILDQLALLGPRINTSTTQHLVGLIPQNKLLDLLAVAISGDTINTIRYAKKLSASVEPASFLSQLATLVTNLLSESSSSPHKKLLNKSQSARLCYILKLLVETERKLQSSTDQNWNIIAAFLDITSSSILLPNSSSFSELKLHSAPADEPHRSVIDEHQRRLDGMKRSSISDMEKLWKDVLEGIESSHTRKFLRGQVKLALLSISRTNAIIHLTFGQPEDKLAAEISEESLTKALEVAIGCPVTLHMSLEPLTLGQDGKSTILSERHSLYSQQQNATTHIPGSSGLNRSHESLIIGQPPAEGSRLRKSKSCSTSQQPHRYSSKGRYLNTAQLQNLSPVSQNPAPECHLTNQRRDLIQAAGDSKNAKQIMRANRPRHRWLSLSSIPQSDASVERYSQDVKYENSNKDGDDTVRKIPKFQKGLSKSSKDRRFQEREDQLQSNPAWYSVDTCC